MAITRHQAVGIYRRWSPPSFDGDQAEPEPAPVAEPVDEATPEPVAARPEPPIEQSAEAPEEPPVKFPTAEEIETMFEEARAEGLAAGFEEGAARAREEAEQLAQVVGAMDAALDRLDDEVATELVELAIAIARQLVKKALAVHPEGIAETVKEALLQLPQSKTKIHVNPQDARLIRDYLQDQFEHGHHQLVDDESITRGGCRLEAAGCEVDATIETRWRRVLEGLGREDSGWDDKDA